MSLLLALLYPNGVDLPEPGGVSDVEVLPRRAERSRRDVELVEEETRTLGALGCFFVLAWVCLMNGVRMEGRTVVT